MVVDHGDDGNGAGNSSASVRSPCTRVWASRIWPGSGPVGVTPVGNVHHRDDASLVVDPADNPETAMQKKNTGEVLRQCVAGLSPAHGQIIDLVYYHEKSVSEVAEILAIPEATVKTRMFYARKRLGDLVMAA